MAACCAVVAGCAVTAAQPLQGEVKLSALFASHMVVQRQKPVRVWGQADRGEMVTVSFRGESVTTKADELGRWEADLQPKEAGGPFSMTVKGSNSVVLEDVMVGDVWLASGQSNMEFPMTDLLDAEKKIAAASCPEVRILRTQHVASEFPVEQIDAPWIPWSQCGPGTVGGFSAVAYYFAKEISEREHVTVGVVEANWGGTLAEAWTSLDALSADAGLMPVFASRARMMDEWSTRKAQEKFDAADKAAGKTVPERPWNPLPEMWEPGVLFNGMIAPLVRFPIRGVIWYQGESNSSPDRAPLYSRLFPALIEDWRSHWGEGDFPFLFTQISSFTSWGEDWAVIRDAQRQSLRVANTAMAVTIDVGDPKNVHPKDKATVGARLALAARALSYGEAVEYAGPLFRQTMQQDHALRVFFDHASGMVARGDGVRGFEVAGEDGKFVTAEAKIEGDSVVVSSSAVAEPRKVRYDWASAPDGNVYNGAGLPMSPFRSQP